MRIPFKIECDQEKGCQNIDIAFNIKREIPLKNVQLYRRIPFKIESDQKKRLPKH